MRAIAGNAILAWVCYSHVLEGGDIRIGTHAGYEGRVELVVSNRLSTTRDPIKVPRYGACG